MADKFILKAERLLRDYLVTLDHYGTVETASLILLSLSNSSMSSNRKSYALGPLALRRSRGLVQDSGAGYEYRGHPQRCRLCESRRGQSDNGAAATSHGNRFLEDEVFALGILLDRFSLLYKVYEVFTEPSRIGGLLASISITTLSTPQPLRALHTCSIVWTLA